MLQRPTQRIFFVVVWMSSASVIETKDDCEKGKETFVRLCTFTLHCTFLEEEVGNYNRIPKRQTINKIFIILEIKLESLEILFLKSVFFGLWLALSWSLKMSTVEVREEGARPELLDPYMSPQTPVG